MASDSFIDNSFLCGVTHDLPWSFLHFEHHKPWQSGLYSKLLVLKPMTFAAFLIATEVGAKMKEHHTDGTTTIRFCKPVLCFRVQEKSLDLQRGHMLTLAPGIKHDVEAQDASAFW